MEEYIEKIRDILTHLEYEHIENQSPDIELWVATERSPKLPWENYHIDDLCVLIPLKTETPDFFWIFMRSLSFLHRHYSWCNKEITLISVNFWNTYHPYQD